MCILQTKWWSWTNTRTKILNMSIRQYMYKSINQVCLSHLFLCNQWINQSLVTLVTDPYKCYCNFIQLFQLTLSDQSIKLEDETARLCGISFLNKFMKTSYASPVQWRFMMASHLDERNSIGYQVDEVAGCFEDGKSGGSSLLPYKKTSLSFI